MTRFIGTPDSVFAGNPGFLENGILNAYITGNVAAGEVCTLFESGVIKRTDPSLPWSVINQNFATRRVITPTVVVENIQMSGMTLRKACGFAIKTPSGLYVVPMQTASGVGFCLRSAGGLQVTNFILAAADSCADKPYAMALPNGNFVLTWHASNVLKHCVFDQFGNSISGIVTVSSIVLASTLPPWHGRAVRQADGVFMLTWCTTGNVLQGQLYSQTGGLIGTTITIDASCSGYAHVLTPCSNGDFAVGVFDSGAGFHKMYRCSSSDGHRLWGPVRPSNATAEFAAPDWERQHDQDNRFIETFSGKLVWVLPDTDRYAKPFIMDASGNFVRKCDFGPDYRDADCRSPIIKISNGFVIAHARISGPQTYCSFYDHDGVPHNINCKVDDRAHIFQTGVNPIVHTYLGHFGSGIALHRYSYYGGSSEVRRIHFDDDANLLDDPDNCQEWAPTDVCSPRPVCDFDGKTFACWFSITTTQLVVTTVKLGRSSVLGVAQSSATDGQPVTILAQGYFRLPATQSFGPGVAFDQRGAPVMGCRGIIGGSNAILFGWAGAMTVVMNSTVPATPPTPPMPQFIGQQKVWVVETPDPSCWPIRETYNVKIAGVGGVIPGSGPPRDTSHLT